MPVIRSAKKKLKVDRKRESANKKRRSLIDISIKKAEKTPNLKNIQSVFSVVDKAVKNKLIHKNKASRIKSRLSKLIKGATKTVKTEAKIIKAKKTKTSKK